MTGSSLGAASSDGLNVSLSAAINSLESGRVTGILNSCS